MKISDYGIKKYECFNREQQDYYEGLSPKQRRYVDLRGQGLSKVMAYKGAGYSGEHLGQGAYIMEERNSGMKELINVLLGKQSNLPATTDKKQIAEIMKNADSETAKRIKFYKDIVDGKIKTIKKTKRVKADGSVIDYKIEEINDLELRMKARQELDRVLGLNALISLDNVQMGDITINIVDASKKDEVQDNRNKIVLDLDKVQEVDGEQVLVAEEHSETVKSEVVEQKTEAT